MGLFGKYGKQRIRNQRLSSRRPKPQVAAFCQTKKTREMIWFVAAWSLGRQAAGGLAVWSGRRESNC